MASKKVRLLSAVVSSLMIFGASSGVSNGMTVAGSVATDIVTGISVNAGTNALAFLGRQAWSNKGKIVVIGGTLYFGNKVIGYLTGGKLVTVDAVTSLVGLSPYSRLKGKNMKGLRLALEGIGVDERFDGMDPEIVKDLINLVESKSSTKPNYRVTKGDIYAVLSKYPNVINSLKRLYNKIKNKLLGSTPRDSAPPSVASATGA